MESEHIKSIILSGGKVISRYKENYDDWYDDAEIFLDSGKYKHISDGIVIRMPNSTYNGGGFKSFRCDQIDQACSEYISEVFSEKNKFYLLSETFTELYDKGHDIDMCCDETLDLIDSTRKAIIRRNKITNIN